MNQSGFGNVVYEEAHLVNSSEKLNVWLQKKYVRS